MRLAMSWCVMVTACYSPRASPGAPCEPALDNCPRGQVCTATGAGYTCEPPGTIADAPTVDTIMIDGRVDASGVGDLDDDSVPDGVDNCPTVKNTDQANEDADPFGDLCDPCPPLVDPSTPVDPDGDGVSGLCDPHPTTPGDAIYLFEGFGAGVPASFRQFGTWTAGTGGTVAASVTAGEHATLRTPSPPGSHAYVATSMVVTANNSGGNNDYFGAGVVARHQTNSDSAIMCHLGRDDGGPERIYLTNTATESHFKQDGFELELGTPYLIGIIRVGNDYTCGAENTTTGQAKEIQDNNSLAAAIPEVGLRIRSGAATYAWLLVVTSP